MTSHTTIEELDTDEVPQPSSPFRSIFEDHQQKPYKFLASVFEFISQETPFFEQPEASKLLARLLRDTKAKKPTVKPAAAQPEPNGVAPSPVSSALTIVPDRFSP